MNAEELLKEGDLDGALASLQDSVRKSPENAGLRVFLFQLFCVSGDWKRAIVQLKTCATLDPAASAMAQMYREAIICEVYREKVFSGEKLPQVFGEPEDWIAWMIEAVKLQVQGELGAAEDLRAKAFEAAAALPGRINGAPFAWVADADPRLGPILEVIVNGRYFWAPFTALHRMVLEPPSDLRDQVWMPARITWSNGGDAVALIPTRYAGSTASDDPLHRLARATGWSSEGGRVAAGLGQRLLASDAADCALMDLRELVIGDLPAVADAPVGAEAGNG